MKRALRGLGFEGLRGLGLLEVGNGCCPVCLAIAATSHKTEGFRFDGIRHPRLLTIEGAANMSMATTRQKRSDGSTKNVAIQQARPAQQEWQQ